MSQPSKLPSSVDVIVELVKRSLHWETQAREWERASNDLEERVQAYEREVERLNARLFARIEEIDELNDMKGLVGKLKAQLGASREGAEEETKRRFEAEKMLALALSDLAGATRTTDLFQGALNEIGQRIGSDPTSSLVTQVAAYAGNAELVREAAQRVVNALPRDESGVYFRHPWNGEWGQLSDDLRAALIKLVNVVPPTATKAEGQ